MAPKRSGRWSRLLGALAGGVLVAAACGQARNESTSEPSTTTVAPGDGAQGALLSKAPRLDGTSGDPELVAASMLAFGSALFTEVSSGAYPGDNVIVSPASVMIALAMIEPGAVGDAQIQLRQLLGMGDPADFHASLNALEQALEARIAKKDLPSGDGNAGQLTARIANASYWQTGYSFEPSYFETVGRYYGPTAHAVDFSRDPDAVAHEINRFVARETDNRIVDLVPDGALTEASRLALVNALYLEASWSEVFDIDRTDELTFTLVGGAATTVPGMHGESDASLDGDGWVAARKNYVGGLAVQFVLPDEGRFTEVGASLLTILSDLPPRMAGGDELVVPRFHTRFDAELAQALQAMGLTKVFEPQQLLGVAADPDLVLGKVIHASSVAMDEQGTEAAAATAEVVGAISAPVGQPTAVVLDRPFYFRIFDRTTGATLFLGRITDPG